MREQAWGGERGLVFSFLRLERMRQERLLASPFCGVHLTPVD
jgi:hypothetical protein